MTIQPQVVAKAGLVITALLWGGNHIVIRMMSGDVNLAAIVFWRWALVLIPILPLTFKALLNNRDELLHHASSYVVLGLISCVVFSFAIIGAPFGTTALNVGLLQATTPIWILLITSLARGKTHTAQLVIVVIGFIGTFLLLTDGRWLDFAGSVFKWGDGVALIASVIWAVYSLRLRQLRTQLSPFLVFSAIVLFGFASLLAVCTILLISGLVQISSFSIPAPYLPHILYVGLGATLVGNLCWNFGVQIIGASVAAQFLFLAPIASTLLAVMILGESLSTIQTFGAFLVAISLLLNQKI